MPERPDGTESVRARRKRAQIRSGALETFLSTGFVGSSMDQVAATAGVSKQTLYAYYRSKNDLLVDVLATLLSEFIGMQSNVRDARPTSPDELRSALIEIAGTVTSLAMREDYIGLVRVLISEMPAMPEVAALWRRTVPEQGMAQVSNLLSRAREAGVVREVDLDLATRLFMGSMLTFVFLDGLARPGDVVVPDRARLEQMVDLYLAAVTVPGPEPAPASTKPSGVPVPNPKRTRGGAGT